MENTTDTPTEGEAPPAAGPSTTLQRPSEGRFVAGVAAGIADRLGVPRWVIRLAFVVVAFSGGAGLLLYVAGWLLIPAEGDSESIGQRWAKQANSTQPWVGIVLIVVAAAILFSHFPFFDGGLLFPTALLVIGVLLYRGDLGGISLKPHRPKRGQSAVDQEERGDMPNTTEAFIVTQPSRPVARPRTPSSPLGRITIGVAILANGLLAVADRLSPVIDAGLRHYLALTVAVIGVGVLAGTFFGRARWLIPIGLLLVPPMIGASVADVDGDWRIPQLVRPTDFTAIAPAYERGAGEIVIDLTRLPWNGETVEFDAEVGVGRLEVVVPTGVEVDVNGDVGIGAFNSPNFTQGGFGVDRNAFVEGGGRGSLAANLDVGIGEIAVEVAGNRLFDGETATEPVFGDLVADVNSPEALQDSYFAPEGDISLDLTDLVLTDDRIVEVSSIVGDITLTLPVDGSYRINARTDSGVVDLFGEDRIDRGGVVRADSIVSGPVLELIVQTQDGDIILSKGVRS